MNAPSPDIDHDALQRALEEGRVVVVDVREPHEYAAGHIAGALNLPLSRFRPEDLPQDKTPVLICQVGKRSAAALRQAAGAGVANVRHYPGGMSGWRTLGVKSQSESGSALLATVAQCQRRDAGGEREA